MPNLRYVLLMFVCVHYKYLQPMMKCIIALFHNHYITKNLSDKTLCLSFICQVDIRKHGQWAMGFVFLAILQRFKTTIMMILYIFYDPQIYAKPYSMIMNPFWKVSGLSIAN